MANDRSTTVDLTQHDDEEPEIPFGKAGSMENPDEYLKYTFDGATTIRQLRENVAAFAGFLDGLIEQDWELTEPVQEGHVHVEYKGTGTPSEQLRRTVKS